MSRFGSSGAAPFHVGRLNGSLQLIAAQSFLLCCAEQQIFRLFDHGHVPVVDALFHEGNIFTVVVAPCAATRFGIEHEREKAHGFGARQGKSSVTRQQR